MEKDVELPRQPGCWLRSCLLYTSERSILSNDANVMCLGALVIGPAAALTYVDRWVDLTFKESPSRKKIDKMRALEK